METKDYLNFNVKEAYNNFVKNTIRNNKEQSKLITPDNMYEQYNKRRKIISAIDDLCFTFEDNLGSIISIFDHAIMRRSWNSEMQKEDTEFILNLTANFITLIGYKDEINKWLEELKGTNNILDEIQIYNLNSNELTDNKKLLDKILKILAKKK